MVVQLGVVGSEHVDLRGGNTGALQLLFDDVQIVQVVAYEITPQHFHDCSPLPYYSGFRRLMLVKSSL